MANRYPPQDIARKQAAKFIDDVLELICNVEDDRYAKPQTAMDIANRLRTYASEVGLEVPRSCNGEAHSNPHIDNCGVCMGYTWGMSGKKVRVR